MSDERHSEVLGGLPRTRPHRRSDKRSANRANAPATDGVSGDAAEAMPTAAPEAKAKPQPKPARASAAKAKPAARKPKSKAKPPAPKAKPAPRAKKAAVRASASAGATTSAGTPRAKAGSTRLRQPNQPDGSPTRGPAKPRDAAPAPRIPSSPKGGEILGTAVQAAAEIAEIGLSAGARALRRAVSRLPRP